jgi:hypothetical protein
MRNQPRSALQFIACALPLLWIGLVLGVSFLATPAKFRAENLDGALALSISMITFAWLHAAETALAIAVVLTLFILKAGWTRWALLAVAALALVLEVDWVLPAFEGRTGYFSLPLITSRQLHIAFAALEGLKILSLATLAFLAFRGSDTAQEAHAAHSPAGRT